MLTAISDGIVALLKDFYGKGPTRAKTYYQDDLVVCLMRDRFQAVIERATGRRVIGFMSGNQQQPDMLCEVFVLAPTDLLDEAAMEAAGIEPARPEQTGAMRR